ncbi:MAG TPA: autotransporter-associated beta strand repeat-containing protein, partial [Chthoniobacteraceae bacterium]|nr:autotransporter-associated beta strand repeat-containing protein [Chthoniobacteraceae bacterium]
MNTFKRFPSFSSRSLVLTRWFPLLAVPLAFLAPLRAGAQDLTATFGNSAQNLFTGSNYTPAITATNAANYDVILSGSYKYSTLQISSYGAETLLFGSLDVTDTSQALTAEAFGSSGNATLVLGGSNGNNTAVTGAGSSADLLYVAPNASLTLTGVSAYLGLTATSSGNFDIQGAAYLNLAVGLRGNGTITKTGTGTLTMTGDSDYAGNDYNTFAGAFVVNQGDVILEGDTGTGGNQGFSLAAGVTVNNGGSIDLTTNNNALTSSGNTSTVITINNGGVISLDTAGTTDNIGKLVLNGGTLTTSGSYTSVNSGYGSYQFIGTVTTGGTATSTISGTGMSLTTSGGVTFRVASTGQAVDLDVPGSFAHYATAGDTGLIKTGPGVMQLDAINTYTSTTTVSEGTLILNESIPSASGTGVLVSTNNVTISDGTLDVLNGNQTLQKISAGGIASIVLGANTVLTGSTVANVSYQSAGNALNINTAAGGANASTSTLGTAIYVPANGGTMGVSVNESYFPSYTVTDAGGTGFLAFNASGDAVRLTSMATLIPQYANSNGDFILTGSLALGGNESIRTLTIAANTTPAVLNTGAYTFYSNGLLFTGTNNASITGSGGIADDSYFSDLYVSNYSTGTVTIAAPVNADSGDGGYGLTIIGPGKTV